MKRSTLLLAGLMLLSSTTVFAEGGAERMRYYFESLRLSQPVNQSTETSEVRVPDDQTAQMTEHYKP